MGYTPAAARHSTLVRRTVTTNPPGTSKQVDNADPATGWNTGEGESKSFTAYTAVTRSSSGTLEALATAGSVANAKVQTWSVEGSWTAHQKTIVNVSGHTAIAVEEGFTRAERHYVTDSDATPISGVCWLDTTKLAFLTLPGINDVDFRLTASAVSGSAKSHITADYVQNTNVWIVAFRYLWVDGTTMNFSEGTYNRTGLDGLSKESDKIQWSHLMAWAGESTRAEAFLNKSGCDGDWEQSSTHRTHQVVPGTTDNGMQLECKTVVDEEYTERTFPADPS